MFPDSFFKSYLKILLALTLIACLILPNQIVFKSTNFYFLFALYMVAIFSFFKIKKKKNYLDFDTIFLLVLSIMQFSAPFYEGTEGLARLFYVGNISNAYFTKGTLLSIVGLVSYMLGSINAEIKGKNIVQYDDIYKYKKISITFVGWLTLFMMLIFVVAGGLDFFRSRYMNQEGTASNLVYQTEILMVVLSNVFCVLLFIRNKRLTKKEKIILGLIFFFSIQLALVGNRTFPSYIILPYLLFYTSRIKPIGIVKTSIGIVVGIIFMVFIQVTRSGGDGSLSFDFLSMTTDLLIPANCFYGSLEYVDKFGLNYGSSMISPLLGLVPGSTAIFGSWNGSAEIMTIYLFGAQEITSGLGTSVITDIYISFGVIGVAILMYTLGGYANKTWKSNLTDGLVKAGMYSSCIFICRSSYFLPVRFIVWGLIFTYFLNKFGTNKG